MTLREATAWATAVLMILGAVLTFVGLAGLICVALAS